MLLEVFEFLLPQECLLLAQVSISWRGISLLPRLWKIHCVRRWSSLLPCISNDSVCLDIHYFRLRFSLELFNLRSVLHCRSTTHDISDLDSVIAHNEALPPTSPPQLLMPACSFEALPPDSQDCTFGNLIPCPYCCPAPLWQAEIGECYDGPTTLRRCLHAPVSCDKHPPRAPLGRKKRKRCEVDTSEIGSRHRRVDELGHQYWQKRKAEVIAMVQSQHQHGDIQQSHQPVHLLLDKTFHIRHWLGWLTNSDSPDCSTLRVTQILHDLLPNCYIEQLKKSNRAPDVDEVPDLDEWDSEPHTHNVFSVFSIFTPDGRYSRFRYNYIYKRRGFSSGTLADAVFLQLQVEVAGEFQTIVRSDSDFHLEVNDQIVEVRPLVEIASSIGLDCVSRWLSGELGQCQVRWPLLLFLRFLCRLGAFDEAHSLNGSRSPWSAWCPDDDEVSDVDDLLASALSAESERRQVATPNRIS
eukprot:TRINITY_DN3071_c0_g1_i1.p1 TRINITY_DN3071_c0_g1~~TRINITY_DN3071_c0_g1_i1.p1  ORF type:complete len:468 (-),score=48.85 TRINITY_DN3071_c0_g1_i1:111-1514(-)